MSNMAPAPKKITPSTTFMISPADDDILRAALRYPYLSIDQVTRLFYSPKSRTTASTRLKRLTDAGYLHRMIVPSRRGNGPFVYALANNGLKFLADAGLSVPKRTRMSQEKEYSYLFFSHTLAVNDFLIHAEQFAANYPDVTIVRQLHEHDLKRQPVYVDDGNGGKQAVIPDAYLDLDLAGRYRMCFALELDRGTEDQKAWRKKVRALLAFVDGPYQQAFGTAGLTVCVIATPDQARLKHGQARLQQLYDWTGDELKDAGKTAEADLFRFASFTPSAATPEHIFLFAGWYKPFSGQAVPLIEPQYWRPAVNGVVASP